VTFSKEARHDFLAFATSREARWPGNFRDFAAAVRRMATLAEGGRITQAEVHGEVARLRKLWAAPGAGVSAAGDLVSELLGEAGAEKLDRFDRAQLAEVLRACRGARSLSEAGRQLFAVSRTQKTSINDTDRLRKYLARFGLEWSTVNGG
jgi:transcriptional regulatory protein RtcR